MIDDLVWAVSSPSLLATARSGDLLDPSLVDAEELMQFLNEDKQARVGYYFEQLIHFWLKRIRGLEIVAHRQQIHEGKLTLGELDFVFRDESGELNHWEAAVKFYLHDAENTVDGSHYVGPNTADTLERKVSHLMERQLPLSERSFPEVKQRHAFVKGRIYYHPRQETPTSQAACLNPDHLRGNWIRMSELDWLDEIAGDGRLDFRILRKPHWLAAATGDSQSGEELKTALAAHFATSLQSVHVAVFKGGVEVRWLFVVADSWPELCQRSVE